MSGSAAIPPGSESVTPGATRSARQEAESGNVIAAPPTTNLAVTTAASANVSIAGKRRYAAGREPNTRSIPVTVIGTITSHHTTSPLTWSVKATNPAIQSAPKTTRSRQASARHATSGSAQSRRPIGSAATNPDRYSATRAPKSAFGAKLSRKTDGQSSAYGESAIPTAIASASAAVRLMLAARTRQRDSGAAISGNRMCEFAASAVSRASATMGHRDRGASRAIAVTAHASGTSANN